MERLIAAQNAYQDALEAFRSLRNTKFTMLQYMDVAREVAERETELHDAWHAVHDTDTEPALGQLG